MISNGIFEVELSEGKKIGFKFGTFAAAITETESKTSILQLMRKIAAGEEATMGLLHYFYGGAVSYAKSQKLESAPSLDEVADMIDAIGFTKALEIFTESQKLPEGKK